MRRFDITRGLFGGSRHESEPGGRDGADRPDSRARRSLGVWRTVAVLATAAVVMLLLGGQPLERSADHMAPSVFRTAAVAVTGAFARAGETLRLDRPWRYVAEAAGQTGLQEQPTGDPISADDPPVTTPPSTLPATPSTTLAASGSTTTTVSSTTTTIEITTTTTLPLFTEQRPLRVLVVGDSLMTPVGFALMRQEKIHPSIEVKAISKASSGLVRPDFYNWPQVLGKAVADFRPHVTVMLFGGNEKQVMRYQGQSFDPFSDSWNAEYAKRVEQVIEISTSAGAGVVWVGMPIMRSGKFSETARTLNAFYGAGCRAHPGADYIDGYALFSDAAGKYSAYLPDSTGQNRLMRASDGIHFTEYGGDRVAEAVIDVLLKHYRLE